MDYSQISLVAPGSAPAGSTVTLEVKVENIASPEHTIYAIPVMRIDGIVLEGSYEAIAPGQIRSWYFQFTMPSNSVTVKAESWCESAFVAWHLDATAQKTVALGEAVPPTEGIGLGLALVGAAVIGIGALALVGMTMTKPIKVRK